MRILSAAKTSTGVVRTENQDFFGVKKENDFFFVCDGMGGGVCGDFASRYASDVILSLFDKITKKDGLKILGGQYSDYDENVLKHVSLIKTANRALYNMTKKYPKLAGMGTTCAGIWVEKEKNLVHIYNVGDSRVYRVRNGRIQLLTEDHSKIKELIDSGKMTAEESKTAEFQSMLTRALGVSETVKVDYKSEFVRSGDVYILCTDGLNGELTDFNINDIVNLHKPDVEEISNELILAVNNSGGRDNTTIISVCVQDAAEPSSGLKYVQQKDIITFSQETSPQSSKEDSLIRKYSKNSNVSVPQLALERNIYKSPLFIALILVLLCVMGLFAYTVMFTDKQNKSIVELTGDVSGINLSVKTINEDKLKEILSTQDVVFRMQLLQDVKRNEESFTHALPNVSVVLSRDGQNKFMGISEYKPMEIKLSGGKYLLTADLDGYKILDDNFKLKNMIVVNFEDSKSLSDKTVIMVAEKDFKNM